ncbi:MAG: ABC transporter ATP-binding protein [Peptoniphilaceae bacterium]|nr:ABC transporter ATP-binding protein [Peptoniphilaceae bacterium]MDY6018698.1 ABC transporter ATP-binding protein [Anaerococcus sp.]
MKNYKLKSKKEMVNSSYGITRLLKYLFKYPLAMVVVIVTVILSSVTQIYGMSLLRPVVDNQILKGDLVGLKADLIKMALIFLVSAISSGIYSRLMVRIAEKSIRNLRHDLFNHVQDLDIGFFDQNTHGEIMSRFTNDTDVISQALGSTIPNIIQSLLLFVGTIGMMFYLNAKLTFLTIISLVIMFMIINKIIKKGANLFATAQKQVGQLNGFIEETFAGQKVVKVFNHEDILIDKFDQQTEEIRVSFLEANTAMGKLMPFLRNASNIIYSILCMLLAILAIGGSISMGVLTTYLTYLRNLQNPIVTVSQQANAIVQAMTGANRIFEIMDLEEEADDGFIDLVRARVKKDGTIEEADTLTGLSAWKKVVDGKAVYKILQGKLEFKNVDFSYNGVDKILKDISFYANPGQKIAFVGSTGAGKTTITNVITRFYDIDSGQIKVDDIDIKDIKKSALRRAFGMVLQDINLFTDTIYGNIRYGRLDANDDEIEAAARLSNADTFITRLPKTYSTKIHGDGSSLSDGQNQLLSIARAAVDEPSILILDEATSSIDTTTEEHVTEAMDNLMMGSTSIVIAHRLSTIKNSDVIMVMDNGRIIERGDHDSLMKKKGVYYQLYTGILELD